MDLSSVVRRIDGFVVFYLPIAFKAVPVIGYYILGNKYYMTAFNLTEVKY